MANTPDPQPLDRSVSDFNDGYRYAIDCVAKYLRFHDLPELADKIAGGMS